MKEGWKRKKLAEITTKIGSGATPLGGEKAYKADGVSLIRSLNVHDMGFRVKELAFLDDKQANKLSNVTVESGDVLLNITGASVARCCIVPDDVLPARVNQHVSIIRLVRDEMLPEFLHYALISNEYKDKLLKTGEKGGSTRQAITKAQIEDFLVEYPPISEQQRIVSVLDEAFASIAQAKANAERNLVNAGELFESHLQEVFTQRSDRWEDMSLGSLCHFENGDRGKNYPNREEYVESGIPWINTGHIQPNGTLSQSRMNYITKEKYDTLSQGKIQPGDLVYCLRGATLGKTALVDPFTEGAVASSLVIIRPSNLLDSRFLYYFLASPIGQGHIKLYDNGAAQPNLAARSVAKYIISLPPLSEQNALVGRLEALSAETGRLEEIYQSKLEALEELKKSVLARAFEGEL